MSFLATLLDNLFPGSLRTGSLSCKCGAVELALKTPASSHLLVEQCTCLCHCKDCVGFVSGLDKDLVSEKNGATQMIQFYKSDIEIVKGAGDIQGVVLKEGSPLIRCYCRRCKTPLGADMVGMVPLSLLYANLLKDYPVFLPNLVMNYASARSGDAGYGRETIVRNGLCAPWFLLRVVARAALGIAFDKGRGGLLQNRYASAIAKRRR